MAKNWIYSNEAKGILTRSYKEETSSLVMELIELYPEFMDFDDAQEMAIVNGIKQKLDDAIARSKDMTLSEEEKREIQETIWLRMSIERKYNTEGKKEKGKQVPLNKAVLALREAGLSAEAIAQTFGKTVEDIQAII